MQSSQRNGILCDLCLMAYNNDFTYYSFDFKPIEVYNNQRPTMYEVIRVDTEKSLDICTKCFDTIKSKIISNYTKNMSQVRYNRDYSICELSGSKLSGSYKCHYCIVTLVVVRLTNQQITCAKCNAKSVDGKKCPKCSSTELVKMAKINSTNRFLEFTISETSFMDMINKANENQEKSNKQWTTTS